MNDLTLTTPKKFVPLSEDERLSLIDPREFYALEGESQDWSDVTVMKPGERRTMSLHIHLSPHSTGRMIRVFDVPQGSRLTIFLKVKVDEAAKWQHVICVRGQGEVRIRRALEVSGTGAQVRIACLGVMENTGRISVSDEIFSYAPDTFNDMCTKIVLRQCARSEARGRIVVGEHSLRSTSYEKLDHLILGSEAGVAVIPELEVKTDEVKCGHGAATSRPDERELFYLASRGLSPTAAEKLLTQGFIAEALQALPPTEQDQILQTLCG